MQIRFRLNPSRSQVVAARPTPKINQFQESPSGRLRMELILSEKKRKPTRTTAETEMVMIPKRFFRMVCLTELIDVRYTPFQQDPKGHRSFVRQAILCAYHSIIKATNLQLLICKFSQAHAFPYTFGLFYPFFQRFFLLCLEKGSRRDAPVCKDGSVFRKF